MSDNKIFHCSFCSSHKDEVTKLIVGEKVAICSDCINLCNKLINDETISPQLSKEHAKTLDAIEIKKYLDEYVIGQNKAKVILSVAIANHYKRINHIPKTLELQKGNILLMGPTGSGKTLLVKTIARYLDVPCVIADATNITEAGYVGEDVENMLSTLLTLCDNDVSKAERGIIFIDEIDKIAKKTEGASVTKDVSGEGVQQALLKILEGTKCKVSLSGKKRQNSETVEIDTKNILFIAGGSFVGLDKVIETRNNDITIGFNAKVRQGDKPKLADVIPEDLVKYGMIPEFIGRFAALVTLNELSLNELIKVLSSVNNCIIDQYKYLFSLDGIDLTFTDAALSKIAQNCIDLKTGARGLQSELERILVEHMYYISKYKKLGISEIVIDIDQIINPTILI